MLTVGGTTIYFGAFFAVTASEEKSHRCRKFGLAHLLGDFDVGGVKLTVAVGLEYSEKISDDLFLPIKKLKLFTRPRAFGMA